jgi:hypothetical protein
LERVVEPPVALDSSSITAYTVVIGVAVLALGGCVGDDEADFVGRAALVSTFQAAGERVTLKHERVEQADPPVDAVYDGAGGTLSDAGFELVVLDDHAAAAKHAVGVLRVSYGQLDVVRHKNVVLVIPSTMKSAREAQLVALLESL